jgi:hypothetical protein
MLSAYHYLPFPIFNVSAGSDEMIFLRLFKEIDTEHGFQRTVGIPKQTGRYRDAFSGNSTLPEDATTSRDIGVSART